MAEENRPLTKENAPNPAHSYERTDPHRESGMGKIGTPKTPPHKEADHLEQTVKNKQVPEHQINAEDIVNQRATQDGKASSKPAKSQPKK